MHAIAAARDQPSALPDAERLRYALQIAEGLSQLHNSKPRLAHRNLKPHNILLDGYNQIKLVDFGLSHTLSQASASQTSSGVMSSSSGGPGADLYKSPEFWNPISDPEHETASDIYSVCLLIVVGPDYSC
jgi:serine/threonine protein kinase